MNFPVFISVFLLCSSLSHSLPDINITSEGLYPEFYESSCPEANNVVISILQKAVANDTRVYASLLRLHFHDCFVQGCDASILLDNSSRIATEKTAFPNINSKRGLEVIDEIKAKLELVCPETVSCADILALAARGSVVLSGGPNWELPLGRRDSMTANFSAANSFLPGPNSPLQKLIADFKRQGLDESNLVALSGGHTIGMSRCINIRRRLYNERPDPNLEKAFSMKLKKICPEIGGEDNTAPLDYESPRAFDNAYFKNILEGRGILSSDNALLTGNVGNAALLVKAYADDQELFFDHFARSMVKMSSIGPLIGARGEVRKNCRCVNT